MCLEDCLTSCNDGGAKWFIFSAMAFVSGTILSIAMKSINPFLYTLAPAQILLLIGLARTGDTKKLDSLIKGVAFSILFSGIALGTLFIPAPSPILTYLLTGGSLLIFSLFVHSTFKNKL